MLILSGIVHELNLSHIPFCVFSGSVSGYRGCHRIVYQPLPYILINSFMAETGASVYFEPATDLFRTPIFFYESLDKNPFSMSNTPMTTVSFAAISPQNTNFLYYSDTSACRAWSGPLPGVWPPLPCYRLLAGEH